MGEEARVTRARASETGAKTNRLPTTSDRGFTHATGPPITRVPESHMGTENTRNSAQQDVEPQ